MDLEIINIDLLKIWLSAPKLYTQHWNGKKKILKFFNYAPDGTVQVKVKGEVVYQGNDIEKAVEVYNGL